MTHTRPRSLGTSVIGLGAAIALAGCVTTQGVALVEAGRNDLSAAVVCCSGLEQAGREPLPRATPRTKPESVLFAIDKARQAFDFGGTKAFFVLFELPPYAGPYSIEFSSEARGSISDSAMFIPRVATYDAQFKPLRYFDEKSLRSRGQQLERTVFINPANAGERYLAVYGSDLSTKVETSYAMVTATPVVVGPVMFNMVSGSETKAVLRSSPTGAVRITVLEPTPSTPR